jgi:hypothetical protein
MIEGCQIENEGRNLAKQTHLYKVAETWTQIVNPVNLKIKLKKIK